MLNNTRINSIMANVAKLKELRNALANFEENFDYAHVIAEQPLGEELIPIRETTNSLLCKVFQHNNVENDCGTVACLAGFAVALHKEQFLEDCAKREDYHPINALEFAKSVLELTSFETDFLFTPASRSYEIYNYYGRNDKNLPFPDYPYDYSFHYFTSCTKEQGYNEALRRLDYIIEYYSNKFNIA